MSSNLVGKVVANQFRVDAFISAGGMGTVFRVWDLKRNVPLAMKVLHADLAEDQIMFERFKREARALRKLEHPNIVPFYGLYQIPSLIFLLEQYIDGPTLKEVLAQRASGSVLSAEQILCIIKALCSAVGYAHSNNVVHCDIKAANVMIDKGGQIYLGDFGIARHAESDVTAMPGAGTPAYMAPEQILGKTVTRETDIYALGVLLFELLTGKRPFRGNETSSEKSGNTVNERIRFAHLNLPAPDPRVIDPKISPAVSAIVLRALEKDPRARFSSCQELFLGLCGAFGVTAEQIPDRLSGIHINTTSTPTDSVPTPPTPRTQALKNPLPVIAGVSVLIVIFVLLLSLRSNPKSMKNNVQPNTIPTTESIITPQQNIQEEPVELEQPTLIIEPSKTNTPVILIVVETPTPTKIGTSTPKPGFCEQGFSQLFEVGDPLRVCTGQDRLILRNEPSPEGGEIFRMYPGVKLTVIGGPYCDPEDTWWLVRVKAGSWVWDGYEFATTSEVEGWVREGGRDGDDYYICPVN